MTKAHPHRQVNVHLDTVDDADIIERIEAQPSMVGYVRKLVRRDIHDERLDYAALKESGLQAENAKLRELVQGLQYCAHEAYGMCARVPVGGERPFTCCPLYDFDAKEYRCEKLMLDLGVGVDG